MTAGSPDVGLEEVRDAFQLLANETRLEILYALWTRPAWEATFTELKSAVAMRDSGQFHYHLDRLAGTFIQRTDGGYTHLAGGITLYRAMLGILNGPETTSSVALDISCPTCDRALELTYENQVLYARCASCEEAVLSTPFLPAGLENRTADDLLSAFDAWSRNLVDSLRDGVCPWCTSTVSHEFEQEEESGTVRLTHRCDRCQGFLTTSVGEAVLSDPAVVSFFYLLGRDVTTVPYWELPFCLTSDGVTVHSKQPWIVEQVIEYEGETLHLQFDDEMQTTVTACSIDRLDS